MYIVRATIILSFATQGTLYVEMVGNADEVVLIICFGKCYVRQAILVTTPSCLQKMLDVGRCSLALVSFIVSSYNTLLKLVEHFFYTWLRGTALYFNIFIINCFIEYKIEDR